MEKYFGQFSKIFDALITHKGCCDPDCLLFSLFVDRCCSLSSEVRLSLICLCCSLLLDLSMFLSSVVRLARLSLCRSLSLCLYCSVVRLARLSLSLSCCEAGTSLSVVLFLVDVLFVCILLYCLLLLSLYR